MFTWVVDEFLNTYVSYRLEPGGTGTRLHFEHSGFDKNRHSRGPSTAGT
ncbi:MAG TPA: hypothetical protein VKF81_16965 [Blastocatellia bacterium]|nr:hypothetical protein [Blastocatellia bacterium]